MRIVSLASGSKGNAYLVRNGGTCILIDAGLSGREVERRLQAVGLLPSAIAALFLTHEHADHTGAAAVLSRRHGWPVFGTEGTLRTPCGRYRAVADGTDRLEPITVGASVSIGALTIRSFAVSHDALDPVGYAVAANGHRLVLAADTGVLLPETAAHLATADALILESNHCPEMLRNGPYPFFLKRRIAGDLGHLSNDQAGDAVRQTDKTRLRYLLLSHLSEINNTPQTAYAAMREVLDGMGAKADLRVCRQHQPGNWIDLEK